MRALGASSLVSGIGLFLALMAWLDFHGYFISPDAIYINILAKSFWAHPYVIWFKRAFSYPYEIIHPDFNFPPLIPLAHWALEKLGVTTWHRGNWMTAFFMGMTVPAWTWALASHFDKRRAWPSALLAGWVATLLLLAQAQNQMWHELYLGIVSPIAVFLFVLSYGAYMRGSYKTCGTLTGAAFLIRFDAQVTLAILVLGHLILNLELKRWKKTARECLDLGLPFLVVTSPWWIRSIALGKPPWFNHMVPIFLYGEAGNFRWFPDTDTALGHPIWGASPYIFYEDIVRHRWDDLIVPYFGQFASELALLGPLLFAGFLYALYRPGQRALLAFVGFGAVLRTLVIAGVHDSFNRRYFLIFDAGAITWITLMLWDTNRWLRWTGRLLCLLLIMANWNELLSVTKSMRPYVGYLDGGMPALSAAIAEIDSSREPVLTAQIEGHGIAYFTDGIPVLELPTNFKDEGVMDAFLARWNIRWTTQGEALKPYLKTHALDPKKATNGIVIHEVRPLRSPAS